MERSSLGDVLLVEDDARLSRSIVAALAPRCRELRAGSSVAAARAHLEGFHPDLVVADVVLPDGTAFDLLDLFEAGPTPAMVAISGAAGPDQSFELSQRGVRAFLEKPFTLEQLDAAMARAVATPPSLVQTVRQVVGKRELHEVEDEVREVMVEEALARAGGSRRRAAKLLGVSRQLLQHALRRRG